LSILFVAFLFVCSADECVRSYRSWPIGPCTQGLQNVMRGLVLSPVIITLLLMLKCCVNYTFRSHARSRRMCITACEYGCSNPNMACTPDSVSWGDTLRHRTRELIGNSKTSSRVYCEQGT
jgi:hypothetical protein